MTTQTIPQTRLADPLKSIVTFLVLTFGLSGIFYWRIIRAGTLGADGGLLTVGLMWSPGVAALLTTLFWQHSLRGLGFGSLKPLRYLAIAYLLPLLYGSLVYGTTWLTGLGLFTTEHLPSNAPLGGYLAVILTLGLVSSLLTAAGEEIGWRGLLVPQLFRLTGFTQTALISGAIWAVWHMPLLLFADYNSGTPAWFALTCFGVEVLGISFAFAWLRLKSGNVWVPILLHASHNLFIQSVFDALTQNTGITSYVTTEFGIGMALVGVVVGFVFWSLRGRLPAASTNQS